MEYSEEKKLYFWNLANTVEGEDPSKVRRDASGAIIHFEDYCNRDSEYGWEIDHVYPRHSLFEAGVPVELINDEKNLRAINWKNNVSKGSDYPVYNTVVTAEGNSNIERCGTRVVNVETQKELSELYKDYLK